MANRSIDDVNPPVNANALASEIREAIITPKANACPMAVRLAWHASGTWDKNSHTGGSNGATMRFEPEKSDDANKGLSIISDMLKKVKMNHPEVSTADIWTLAGCAAVEFSGGPKIPHKICRQDDTDGRRCPENGRLPDASLGAAHLREVFYRMGFNDRDIVALSGAHTLGRCHLVRSGYDGPWTHTPLTFNNAYFKNLWFLDWTPKKWDGPLQFEDPKGELMMLPSDMALKTDKEFAKYVELYANDEQTFFRDFADAFARLLANGTSCPYSAPADKSAANGAAFREAAMHGSIEVVERLASQCDVHEIERSSGRTALHKAAFWGHEQTVRFLLQSCKLNPDVQDYNGDTALHDAARFGHIVVCQDLLAARANPLLENKQGHTAGQVAALYEKPEAVAVLNGAKL